MLQNGDRFFVLYEEHLMISCVCVCVRVCVCACVCVRACVCEGVYFGGYSGGI